MEGAGPLRGGVKGCGVLKPGIFYRALVDLRGPCGLRLVCSKCCQKLWNATHFRFGRETVSISVKTFFTALNLAEEEI